MKKTLLFPVLLFISCVTQIFSQNWIPVASNQLPKDYHIYSISTAGDNVVWAVASGEFINGIPLTHKSHYLRSADGGNTWFSGEIEEAIGTISFRIVAENDLTAVLTIQDYGNGAGRSVLKTTDGGETWQKITDFGGGVALTKFSDGKHWLSHNRQTIGLSSDNCENWIPKTISGYGSNEYQILYSGTNMACAVGDTVWNGTDGGKLVRFTKFGADYKFINTSLGTGSNITSIAFENAQKGILYYYNSFTGGKLARSTDGGNTWSQLSTVPPGTGNLVWNLAAVPGAPGNYVMVTADHILNGQIAHTKDFGATWKVELIGEALNCVEFSSPKVGWAGAGKIGYDEQPALYKYVGAPLAAKTADFETISVSPNPVSDFLKIENLKEKSVPAVLTDVVGRLVFSGKIFDNQLNVSGLQAGVYFLKIKMSGKTGVAKFVKT